MSWHWPSVGDANPDIIIRAVVDPVCLPETTPVSVGPADVGPHGGSAGGPTFHQTAPGKTEMP